MEGLCRSCAWFNHTQFGNGYSRDYCTDMGMELKSYAVKCRSYSDGRKKDFERMAWILEKKTKIGFDGPVFELKPPNHREESPFQ